MNTGQPEVAAGYNLQFNAIDVPTTGQLDSIYFRTGCRFLLRICRIGAIILLLVIGTTQNGNTEMASRPERNAHYVARHNVRKFLSEFATPSALVELVESIENVEWYELVQSVHVKLTGERVKET